MGFRSRTSPGSELHLGLEPGPIHRLTRSGLESDIRLQLQVVALLIEVEAEECDVCGSAANGFIAEDAVEAHDRLERLVQHQPAETDHPYFRIDRVSSRGPRYADGIELGPS